MDIAPLKNGQRVRIKNCATVPPRAIGTDGTVLSYMDVQRFPTYRVSLDAFNDVAVDFKLDELIPL